MITVLQIKIGTAVYGNFSLFVSSKQFGTSDEPLGLTLPLPREKKDFISACLGLLTVRLANTCLESDFGSDFIT